MEGFPKILLMWRGPQSTSDVWVEHFQSENLCIYFIIAARVEVSPYRNRKFEHVMEAANLM